MQNTKKVFVGLSGGVDSSVAALRLKQAGFDVVGVFIKVWHPDFMVCNWEQERLDAMRVAAHLDIPFLTCDAEETYRQAVADAFILEYKSGRTPNPDVLCNREVKFGAFLKFAEAHGADAVATGHYARIDNGSLLRGVDTNKDQSYFLWALTTEQLQKIILPVGDTTKDKIREEAKAAGIPTAQKKDSQGICFLGHVDIPEFLSHYIDLKPGDVLDEAGTVIGTHAGALVYTAGQRHGFTITELSTKRKPYFVTTRDISQNTITVSTTPPVLRAHDTVQLTDCVLRRDVAVDDAIEAQFRYRQEPFRVAITSVTAGVVTLSLSDSVTSPAAGQSCVLYDGATCIGGGILK